MLAGMSTPAPASVPRRRGRPGHDPDTVLAQAVALFNRQGYDATSMSDLARELGLSKATIYHHVPSKTHLLERALDEALDALERVVSRTTDDAEPAGTAYGRLRAVVTGSVETLAEHLPAVTLLLRVRGNSDVELAALRRRRRIDEQLAELVAAAVDEGALRDDLPPLMISRLLFGTVNSLVEWYRPRGDREDVAALAAMVTTLVFDGLTRPPDRPARTSRPPSQHPSPSTPTTGAAPACTD